MVVQCKYRTGNIAYLTCGIDVASKRVRVLTSNESGRWIVRWESLKRLHDFRLFPLSIGHELNDKKWPLAHNHWSNEVVDNLNQLSEALVMPG